nr:DUF397 domain-containing protein [Actinomadura sp. RB99]
MAPLTWRKSTYSTEGTSAQCVEVAALSDAIGVRDSKDPEGAPCARSRTVCGARPAHQAASLRPRSNEGALPWSALLGAGT